MKTILLFITLALSIHSSAETLKCSSSTEDADTTVLFNLTTDSNTTNLQLDFTADTYSTYCDTPGSCPTRYEFLETIQAVSGKYSFKNCKSNKENSVVLCFSYENFSKFSVEKTLTTKVRWDGTLVTDTGYKVEFSADGLENESDIINPSKKSYLTWMFNECELN